MLAFVAVDEDGVVALVEHQFEDADYGFGWGGDVGGFVGEDGEVVVGYAVGEHEGRVGGWDVFGDEGDDCSEVVELQLIEVRGLGVGAPVDSWADHVEVGG